MTHEAMNRFLSQIELSLCFKSSVVKKQTPKHVLNNDTLTGRTETFRSYISIMLLKMCSCCYGTNIQNVMSI